MRRNRLLFAVCLSLTIAGSAGAAVTIVSVEPTPLFPTPAGDAPLSQLATVTVHNDGAALPLKIAVDQNGISQPADLGSVPAGDSTQSVLLPDVETAVPVTVRLLSVDGAVAAEWKGTHQPQRKWTVYIVKSSHEDLGYEDYIYNKQREIANNIDLAKKRSAGDTGAAAGASSARGYHYMLESLIFQQAYIDERSEAAWRQLVETYIKPGVMPLIGVPNGVHTHWLDYESLARFMYPGRRDLVDRFGLDPKTFLIVDNPSISWSAAQAAADAGFKYACRFGQPWRTGDHNDYDSTKLPALFWWKTPDGKHRLLFGWRSHYARPFWYGNSAGGDVTDESMALGAINVTHELQNVESGKELGPYPYDALLVPSYSDHETPAFDARALSAWAKLYRYPEIRIAGPETFFEHIEQKYAKDLPELSGDLNNFSGDYATIDPQSQGWERTTARLLPAAETQAAFAAAIDPSYFAPEHAIEQTFGRLFAYAEHSWPTSPPPGDVHIFNAQWVKHNEAARALDAATQINAGAQQALYHNVPTDRPTLLVFNPLAHERTDLVEVAGITGSVIDPATGKPIACQPTADGKLRFLAHAVPAMGYKTYAIDPTPPAKPAADASIVADGDRLENAFYAIRFDTATGTVRSIVDKPLNQELIDPAAPQKFNQLIWLHTKDRLSNVGKQTSPTRAKSLIGSVGPVSAEMVAEIDDDATGAAITQTVRLYAGVKRIDVIDDLRHVKAMYSPRYQDRYRDNLFYAFPIKVDGFEARAEYPGGTVRPNTDQLRWGSHDYLTPDRWVDVSNKQFGVTMAPWNAPTVMFGDIRYNDFSIDYKPANSHLFSYAWSNRMAGLLTLCPDDCNATFGYSFTSHAGGWDSGQTTPFGWSVATPLQAIALPAGQHGSLPGDHASLLSVDAPNVQVTTLKPSEQPGRGWICRLVETEGKSANVEINLPTIPADSASDCDLVENDLSPLAFVDHRLHVAIGPYEFKTIRVFKKETPPAAVEAVQAVAVNDASIHVTWKPSPSDGITYNIYRSEDPDAPATAYTLIARAAKPDFVDTGLSIDTKYIYAIAAVSPDNTQGAASEKIACTTSANNTSPPLPVCELGIVRRSKTRLTIYWRRTHEPDVARYFVYRSATPDIDIIKSQPIGQVSPGPAFLETFGDDGLQPGTTYFYKVIAEDWAGHRQADSPVVSATTPKG